MAIEEILRPTSLKIQDMGPVPVESFSSYVPPFDPEAEVSAWNMDQIRSYFGSWNLREEYWFSVILSTYPDTSRLPTEESYFRKENFLRVAQQSMTEHVILDKGVTKLLDPDIQIDITDMEFETISGLVTEQIPQSYPLAKVLDSLLSLKLLSPAMFEEKLGDFSKVRERITGQGFDIPDLRNIQIDPEIDLAYLYSLARLRLIYPEEFSKNVRLSEKDWENIRKVLRPQLSKIGLESFPLWEISNALIAGKILAAEEVGVTPQGKLILNMRRKIMADPLVPSPTERSVT